jgi:UDP-glucose-4-epimerase GalE
VVVLDTLERGVRERCVDVPFVQGDAGDGEVVRRVCEAHGVDAVVHMAGLKSVRESMERPGLYFERNVAVTARLLEACAESGVRRVVFSSSASVYGTPVSVPVSEEAPVAPESVYAETKAACERICEWYDRTMGVQYVALRYFNAAGASDDGMVGEDDGENLVPRVVRAVRDAEAVTVHGLDWPTADGTGVRDYIHVEDLAEAHVAALVRLERGAGSLVCNVGTGSGSSVLDVIDALERVAQRPCPVTHGPRRDGDVAVSVADVTLADGELGWVAERTLDEIAASAWRWATR